MEPANHLRTYSVAELERIATEHLKKLVGGFTIPLDVDYIIEQLPGVDLGTLTKPNLSFRAQPRNLLK